MKCDDWQLLVEEYFDGELDPDMALKVRNHLDDCSSCSSLLRSLSVERAVYAGYQSDVEVAPKMWATVSRRIEASSSSAPPTNGFVSWLRNAVALPAFSARVTVALVLVAVVLTVVIMRYMSSPRGVDPQSAVSGVSQQPSGASQSSPATRDEVAVTSAQPSPPAASPAKEVGLKRDGSSTSGRYSKSSSANRETVSKTKDPSRLVREAEQKYLAAIAMLSRNVDRKRSRLDPATIAELDQALSSIDRTIAATRNAVRRHPDDPLAAQYMLTAYAKKVDVLRGLADY